MAFVSFSGLASLWSFLPAIVHVILIYQGYDPLATAFSSFPLNIRTDEDYLKGLAWSNALKDPLLIDVSAEEKLPVLLPMHCESLPNNLFKVQMQWWL